MSKAERIGIFGGGFDPPHLGHVRAAQYALQHCDIDRLFVIPTAEHPFEKDHRASFEHRMRMAELAFFSLPKVEVLGIEAERLGPSRTYETLLVLQQRYPQAKFFLVLGSDHKEDCERWYKWDALQRLATPCWVPREGSSEAPDAIKNINSTALREALKSGAAGLAELPSSVVAYIAQYELYRDKL